MFALSIESLVLLLAASSLLVGTEAGIIKDIYQKITHSNNKTEDTVKQSAPVCGSGIFSTPNEKNLSPEFIFITNRPIGKANSQQQSSNNYDRDEQQDRNQRGETSRRREEVSEVAREFRFNEENVTLAELERHGFNRDAPVSFLMHGFTSGYPLQAWISAIVEAYTIDRSSSSSSNNQHQSGYNHGNQHQNQNQNQYGREQERRRDSTGEGGYGNNYGSGGGGSSTSGNRVNHNLFIINWNYAARGALYPRAVANIPIVASYATRFINDKLIGEAGVDPRRIQLIGHSLGAHLAGFIGKNTKSKVGRIYGLDPAGPCFGTISGPLYPASKRLAPTDAEEVITIHTNTALLGIEKPIGKYSVYVEGGSVQPGCKGGGVFKSLQTLTWDGGDFDTIACSHSRAPNLLTYRHDQSDTDDDCQLVAYECKDWDSFAAGHCGVCNGGSGSNQAGSSNGASRSVECLRIGLDWQYPKASGGSGQSSSYQTTRRPTNYGEEGGYNNYQTSSRRPNWNNGSNYGDGYSSTRRPTYGGQSGYQTSTSGYGFQQDGYSSSTRRPYTSDNGYNNQNSNDGYQSNTSRRPQQNNNNNNNDDNGYSYGNENNSGRRPTRRPNNQDSYSDNQRNKRAANETSERRASGEGTSGENKVLFLRTGDTQPYCAYQYQVILELNEPFKKKKPPISLLLQDSESRRSNNNNNQGHQSSSGGGGQNSLSNDEFGNKFDDRTYTHLLTSGKKLGRIDHATLLFREGLPDGMRTLKALHVNYMSHIDPHVRRRLSAKLCPVRKNPGQGEDFSTDKRFYFEPCTDGGSHSGDSHSNSGISGSSGGYGRDRDPQYGSSSRRPYSNSNSNNNNNYNSNNNQRDRE